VPPTEAAVASAERERDSCHLSISCRGLTLRGFCLTLGDLLWPSQREERSVWSK
jgi:hypothetical protein